MPWVTTSASSGAWSGKTATDMSRQFQTLGSFASGDYTNFVLSVDESHPLYLSDTAQPFLVVQEVMVSP